MRRKTAIGLILGLMAAATLGAAGAQEQETAGLRGGYSHVTAAEGTASVLSEANGRSDAALNLPLSAGDQVTTQSGGRLEIELAGGDRIQVAGESQVRLDAVAGEAGSNVSQSIVNLLDGSLAAESVGGGEGNGLRIDTADTTIDMPSRARVRINADAHRGTTVVVRDGSVQVRTRTGSTTVKAGNYLMVQADSEPEVARGTFSRDRFDVWVSDRTQTALAAYNSASARYVDSDYSGDTAGLDGYGKWDYSASAQSNVWRPTVDAEWSPYGDGYWYYTPAGAAWVSNEPWGWFPYHYGNWYWDAGWNSWAWMPAYVYSPAWVYWCYSAGFVGWCPIGYYTYFGPYSGYWGWRPGIYFSVCGRFNPRRVDFQRGWSFVGTRAFGSRLNRSSIVTGGRALGRLGNSVTISSSPIRLASGVRGGTGAAALQAFAERAPQTVARQASGASAATLEPFLARQKSLSPDTVNALRQTQMARVDPATRSLTGPAAAQLSAPTRSAATLRGGFNQEKSLQSFAPRAEETWRTSGVARNGNLTRRLDEPSPEAWRTPSRSFATSQAQPIRHGDFSTRAPGGSGAVNEEWRGRSRVTGEPGDSRSRPAAGSGVERPAESWRSRASTPPVQRVIEGVDRGRSNAAPQWEDRPQPRPRYESAAPRSGSRPESGPRSEPHAAPAPSPHSAPSPHGGSSHSSPSSHSSHQHR